jgi:delta1-piperideine-2-carboxylate reductase
MSTPSKVVEGSCVSIGFPELVALLHQIFVRHGTSPEVAAILSRNCASAERDGAHSHGIFRMPGYLSTLALLGQPRAENAHV